MAGSSRASPRSRPTATACAGSSSTPATRPRTRTRSRRSQGADLIVLGPGSLFTSTLPPLLVPALRRAILSARAPRVYVCNLLQQPGETIGYRASHHLERLHQHVGPESVDIVLVPSEPVIADPLIPVDFDVARLRELGVKVVRRPIADGHHHDPAALAHALAGLARRRAA